MEKQKYIESLNEGEQVDDLFMVKAAQLSTTRAGKSWLRLELMDKTGEISAPVWENAEGAAEICRPGTALRCAGQIGSWQGSLRFDMKQFAVVSPSEVDLSAFLPATRACRRELARDLQKLLVSVADESLSELLKQFFGPGPMYDAFKIAPAAKGVHHACVGGLLEHSLSVAKVVDMLTGHYPGINRDLVVSGALLHDIGKMREMGFEGAVVLYTPEGRLKGHITIGIEMIGEAVAKLKHFPRETLNQLQHLILSHHGRNEYGSPVVPMTPEAFLLSMADELDARMNMIENLRVKLDSGVWTMTEYQRLLERYLYLSGYEKQPGEKENQPRRNQPSLFDSELF